LLTDNSAYIAPLRQARADVGIGPYRD